MSDLGARQQAALDELLRSLDLEACGDDCFRAAPGRPGPFGRTFGGQLVAQALAAASRTVDDMAPSSLHAYFAASGDPTEPVDVMVRRVRDGRSMATREVSLEQAGRTLLTAIAAFHRNPDGPELAGEPLAGPGPTELPTLQDWVPDAPPSVGRPADHWIDLPPPIEVRIGQPTTFLGGEQTNGSRSHWLRLVRPVDSNPTLQAALLAHASDYLLLDMAFRSHPVPFTSGRLSGTSLDHSIWFHRPVRLDRWHRYTQETVALVGERGLVQGAIHDEDGRLVASTAQEVLVRVADA